MDADAPTIDTPRATLRSPAIGGSDIGRCLTRIHHDRFTPATPIVDPARARMLARGRDHEAAVVETLLDHRAGAVRIEASGRAAVAATIAALGARAPIVVGARLQSADGRLVGLPDLLVLLGDGYAPVEIKHHKVVGDTGPLAVPAPLESLTDLDAEPVRFRSRRRRDLLQVAHYHRLLAEVGHASTRRMGGVIGADDPAMCLWVDLTEGEPSLLDERDAYVARAREAVDHGGSDPDTPLVAPWWRSECATCDWRDLCLTVLRAVDDPTLLRDVDDDLRASLASDGVDTIADVAALEPDDERVPGGTVVFQARARTAGTLLRSDAGRGPLDLPHPRIEVDLDIETLDGRTYLAGLLITRGGRSRYEALADWSGTELGERHLLASLFDRFASWTSPDVLVYHWTDYERTVLSAAAERHGLAIAGFDTVDEWFDAHACDLCDWCRHRLVSPDGFSLKTIAPLCGFAWRDADPGGLQSEVWFERLRQGEDTMRGRLLAYNEDDVLAQLAVRRWIRARDDGTGPGSAIPSVSIPPGVSGRPDRTVRH